MSQHERRKALEKMHRFVQRTRSPRLGLSIIIGITVLIIFLSSYGLFEAGFENMALRYVMAIAIGYAAFIGLLFLWTHDQWDIPAGDGDPVDDGMRIGCHHTSDASTLPTDEFPSDAVDVTSVFDLEELAIVLVIVAGVVFAFYFVFSLFYGSAGFLLAELMFDAGLAASLYKGMSHVPREIWFVTAIRRTWRQFAFLAFVMAGLGWILARHVPGATTLGAALKALSH